MMGARGLPAILLAPFIGPFVANLGGKDNPIRNEIKFSFFPTYFIILSKQDLNTREGSLLG